MDTPVKTPPVYDIHPLCEIFREMSPPEFERLCASVSEGYDEDEPVYLYEGKILDGRNRYRAALAVGATPVFKEWQGQHGTPLNFVIRKNGSRRDLTVNDRLYTYEKSKKFREKAEEEARERMLAGPALKSQPTPHVAEDAGEALEIIGRQLGIGKSTLKYYEAVKREDPQLAQEILEGKISVTAASFKAGVRKPQEAPRFHDVRFMDLPNPPFDQVIAEKPPGKPGKLPPPRPETLSQSSEEGDTYEEPEAFTEPPDASDEESVERKAHVAHNSGNNEWYTPDEYISAARSVMGQIDLDPASSLKANLTVQAARIYTADDDGTKQPWRGKVWMNPPYSQPLIGVFCQKLVEELDRDVDEAIVLVNNATETAWGQTLMQAASAVCFPKGRIRFIDPDGNPGGAPLQGQAIYYFGPSSADFVAEFEGFGCCLVSPS